MISQGTESTKRLAAANSQIGPSGKHVNAMNSWDTPRVSRRGVGMPYPGSSGKECPNDWKGGRRVTCKWLWAAEIQALGLLFGDVLADLSDSSCVK